MIISTLNDLCYDVCDRAVWWSELVVFAQRSLPLWGLLSWQSRSSVMEDLRGERSKDEGISGAHWLRCAHSSSHGHTEEPPKPAQAHKYPHRFPHFSLRLPLCVTVSPCRPPRPRHAAGEKLCYSVGVSVEEMQNTEMIDFQHICHLIVLNLCMICRK